MPLLRRSRLADPDISARLSALLPASGWVPPGQDEASRGAAGPTRASRPTHRDGRSRADVLPAPLGPASAELDSRVAPGLAPGREAESEPFMGVPVHESPAPTPPAAERTTAAELDPVARWLRDLARTSDLQPADAPAATDVRAARAKDHQWDEGPLEGGLPDEGPLEERLLDERLLDECLLDERPLDGGPLEDPRPPGARLSDGSLQAGPAGAPGRTAPNEAAGPLDPGSTWDRWRQGRLDPGRQGVAALALVAVLAALLAGVVVLRSRPHEVVPPPVVASGVPVPGSSPGAASPEPTQEVVVSVGGKVAQPGLVKLPSGSRVDDAVKAAGVLPGTDLGDLNLARKLVDGEQVLVGVPQPAGVPGATPSAGGLLDLNAATLEQFDDLPGIGPVLAQKILDWRTEHGRFGSVDQLREVSGIGESKYAELEAKVRV